MQKLFAKLFLIIMLILFATPRTTSAMHDILPFDKLKNGMNGKAYTVVDGSGRIEDFNVDIIGITDEGKGSKRMIMAQVSGEVIKRTGGILQGMSGSPVYINGKLVGAISATLKEMDPCTVFITPIEDMIELLTLPDPKAESNYLKIVRMMEEEKKSKKQETKEETSTEPKETSSTEETTTTENPTVKDKDESIVEPLKDMPAIEETDTFYISGFDSSGIKFLQRELGLQKLQSSPVKVERGIKTDAVLSPGSALGVAVIYGDFSLGATGTVTAVDGKKILAFGHSFTHAGNVNYFMTDASVIGSVSGITGNGVKLAGIGHIIGRINQDRDSGIAGILGTFPAVVPFTVTIHNKAFKSIAYTALSKMADSLAESTVEINFNVKTNAVESGELTRKNMFYNPSDVGQIAVLELMQALNLICSNTKEESDIFGVNVDISFDMERRTASIISVTPDKKTVKPGETINLTVELQPYRKPIETVIMPYTVPLTAHQGNLSLEIHGGALVPVNQVNSGLITADSNKSYEDKIKEFLKTGKNNQLVVEVGGSNENKTRSQIRREIAQAKRIQARLKKEGKTFQKESTLYFLLPNPLGGLRFWRGL